MPFSFLPQYPPFSSPSFCSAVAMTTAALHHSSAGDLGSCSCSESAPLTSIHNTLSANAVTEANEELSPYLCSQALRRKKLPVLIFFFLLVFSWCRRSWSPVSPQYDCHRRGVTSVSRSDSVTAVFFLPPSLFLPLFLPPTPPPLAPPVTAISA